MKRHNVCKRHGFLDTWLQTNWHAIFSTCYSNGKNLHARFESSCGKWEQKFSKKMPGCFAAECQHITRWETLATFSASQRAIYNWKGGHVCAGTCLCLTPWFVYIQCLQPASTCRHDCITKWRHHCSSV